MNYQAKPFPAGCDQQSRYVTRVVRTSGDEPWHLPHMEAGALLMAEDAMGICDTCPGELDYPEAVYQAEPDRPRFAHLLAPAFDRWPRATTVVVLVTLMALWGFAGQLDLN